MENIATPLRLCITVSSFLKEIQYISSSDFKLNRKQIPCLVCTSAGEHFQLINCVSPTSCQRCCIFYIHFVPHWLHTHSAVSPSESCWWLVLLSVSTHCELLHLGLCSMTTTSSLWCRMKRACSALTTLQSNTDRQTQSVPLHDSSSFLWQLLGKAASHCNPFPKYILFNTFIFYSHPFNAFILIMQYNKTAFSLPNPNVQWHGLLYC